MKFSFARVCVLATVNLWLVAPATPVLAQSAEDEVLVLDDEADQAEAPADAGTMKLKRLVIGTDNAAATPADVAAPVTVINSEALRERFAISTDDAIRSTPGAYTRQSAENPGVIVNVRGMQGMGRVNTMIDGVPQTFRNLSGHSGTFDNMVYIDKNLLAGVDIRGARHRVPMALARSGAADFRTIGINDVLMEGKDYGGLVTLSAGTNGYDFSRLTALGWRKALGLDGSLSIMGALSGTNMSNYKNGDGILYPYDASQQPRGALFKVNYQPNAEHSIELGHVRYANAFSVESAGYDWQIDNQTYTLKYAYQPGDNLIDLRVNAFYNVTDVLMSGTDGYFNGREGTSTGLGLDISNTSVLDLNDTTSIKFFYGAAINSDDYQGNDQRGANPDGRLIKSGVFADATLTRGIFGMTAGLRYDAWNLSGVTEYLAPGTPGCATGDSLCAGDELTRSGGQLNPKLGLTADVTDWAQVYANYAYSMRPPTASEMFYPGGHNFDGTSTPIQNNPNLVPERQKGLDIGMNVRGDELLTSGDQGYLKLGYFRNRISDYITYATDPADGETRWVNLPGVTTMQGVEIEAGYDIGVAYVRASATIAETEQPLAESAGIGNDVGRLPDDFATLDGGLRFFEQKLTLGGRLRHTGDSVQAFGDAQSSICRPSYQLVDLYGSYQMTENFKLFISVENLFDRSYWSASSGIADSLNTVTNGRGRTIMIGATAQF